LLVRVGDESIAEIESAVDVPVALAVVGLESPSPPTRSDSSHGASDLNERGEHS
jgi:hypothetical protein